MMRMLMCIGLVMVAGESVGEIPKPDDAPRPMRAEASAKSYQLPAGFKMKLVASEPLIASPSGVCWDERGRMFVSELHGYNLAGELDIRELNKTGKLDTQVRRVRADEKHYEAAAKQSRGVVKLLRDTDGDGVMDEAEVWADDLPPAYGLVAARGGVIVACAPDIVYLADRDGDGKAEVREVLFTGFETGELERGVNAPQWGDDGWIYFGSGAGGGKITGLRLKEAVNLPGSDFRIRADGSAIEPVTGETHTFGFAIDGRGDRFVVSTTAPALYVAPLKWEYLVRNPNMVMGGVTVRSGDRRVYPRAAAHPWRKKRATHKDYSKYYRDRYGASDSDADGWFTSACGSLVYRDGVLPGLKGQYFVCEPAGSLIHRAAIVEDGSVRRIERVKGEEKAEFAAASDSWSHPIFLTHDPFGTITVVDYYREIIEDYSAIPRHLQQQYGLYAGHDKGRIYRIVHEGAEEKEMVKLDGVGVDELVEACGSELLWERQTAQRVIVERKLKQASEGLRELIKREDVPAEGMVTAMRTLAGLGVLRGEDLLPLIKHKDVNVRVHALALAGELLARKQDVRLVEALLSQAEKETHARVVIQYGLTLGEVEDERVVGVLARLMKKHGGVQWMDTAALSSVHGRSVEFMAALAGESVEHGTLPGRLARSIAAEHDVGALMRVLEMVGRMKQGMQMAVLQGLQRGWESGEGRGLNEGELKALVKVLGEIENEEVLRKVYELQAKLKQNKNKYSMKYPKDFEIPALPVSDAVFRKYLEGLKVKRDAKRGHEVFVQTCAVCHRIGDEGKVFGPDLMGEVGVAEETMLRHLLVPAERIRPGYETMLVEKDNDEGVLGLIINDGATSVKVLQPGGVAQDVLRKDIRRVRKVKGSLMPSFANVLPPEDVGHLLFWLREQLRGDDGGRVVLFDDDPGFVSLLTGQSGTASLLREGAFSGEMHLKITPPQKASPRIPGWGYRIVEKPTKANEFRYMRLAWKTTGDGVMVEIANDGRWPDARSANGRFYAGKNTTTWAANQVSDVAPGEWTVVTFDLWKDWGTFTLTGLAPTAMGNTAYFDKVELLKALD